MSDEGGQKQLKGPRHKLLVLMEVAALLLVGAGVGIVVFYTITSAVCRGDEAACLSGRYPVIEQENGPDAVKPIEEEEAREELDEPEEVEGEVFETAYGGVIVERPEKVGSDPDILDRNATFLRQSLNRVNRAYDERCLNFENAHDLFGSDDVSFSVWEDQSVQGVLKDFSGTGVDAVALHLLKSEHREGRVPRDICLTDEYFYITVTSGASRVQILRHPATEELRAYDRYQTVHGVFDLSFSFVPEYLNGHGLLQFSGGDAGHVWWGYYFLNGDVLTSDLVESCFGSEDLEAVEGRTVVTYSFGCPREYVPLQNGF